MHTGVDMSTGVDVYRGVYVCTGVDVHAGVDVCMGIDVYISINVHTGVDMYTGVDVHTGVTVHTGIDVYTGIDVHSPYRHVMTYTRLPVTYPDFVRLLKVSSRTDPRQVPSVSTVSGKGSVSARRGSDRDKGGFSGITRFYLRWASSDP